ncbi:PilZ domain-containing protein [Echinimonas agarilytica]|uniref:PilZ domain-containing protein n=1 Tax=Echinimonas agarilytica TaxID=1215918 RepID=A0AA41WAB6_9GAMM|nr:PilZ domain-containing protein [Echinimonas agarilytica]MCM2681227.1 PilZ domain-containing protein [Echinimonas agarilytica]
MSKPEVNLVHETEAQRRHARVKIPARITYTDKNGVAHALEVMDLSASGFSATIVGNELTNGSHYKGDLLFKLNSVEFRLPINFSVKYLVSGENKAGCEFSALGQEEISLLRLFISKYLAGDLTTTSDILTTVSRDNFTKSRKKGGNDALSGWRKVRALGATAAMACVGLMAFGYICTNLYQHYFVTHAITAMVDIEREPVLAPTNGYFELVANPAEAIQQGLPLATITSSVYEVVNRTNMGDLSAQELEQMLPSELNSLVKSPCDCQIVAANKRDREFATQGDVLFDLARVGTAPHIAAKFNYSDAKQLVKGKQVSLEFPGMKGTFSGTIATVMMSPDAERTNTVVATIIPEKTLPLDTLSQPVNVSIGHSSSFSVVSQATASEG